MDVWMYTRISRYKNEKLYKVKSESGTGCVVSAISLSFVDPRIIITPTSLSLPKSRSWTDGHGLGLNGTTFRLPLITRILGVHHPI